MKVWRIAAALQLVLGATVICRIQADDLRCSVDCGRHGTCIAGTCDCDDGYGGTGCIESPCPNDCSNHGQCDVSTKTCDCSQGWAGENCNYVACPSDCSGHGNCNSNGECDCSPQFMGFDCSLPACTNSCSSKGVCKEAEDGGSHRCMCEKGYTGSDCSVCDSSVFCGSHGACFDPLGNSTVICYCDDGYTGEACEISKCPTATANSVCSGHGICDGSTGDYACMCDNHWTNDDCSFLICHDSSGRYTNANCSWDAEKKTLSWECLPGYTGPTCDDYAPASCISGAKGEICNGHGACVEDLCYCADGWLPPLCKHSRCVKDCSENGVCIDGVCKCEPGFLGPDCLKSVYDVDFSTVKECRASISEYQCLNDCNGRGICDILSGRCTCTEPYFGIACELQHCPDDCNGQGICDSRIGTCTCIEGFTGEACVIGK